MKKVIHLFITLLLVFTTTGSIWVNLLANNDDDPIEISSESDSKKTEKEIEKELDDWDDDLASEIANHITQIYCGFLKIGSSTFAPSDEAPKRLYLIYQHLKLDC